MDDPVKKPQKGILHQSISVSLEVALVANLFYASGLKALLKQFPQVNIPDVYHNLQGAWASLTNLIAVPFENQWNAAVDYYGHFWFGCIGSWLLIFVFFWVHSFVMMFMDFCMPASFVHRFRVQPASPQPSLNDPEFREKFWNCVRVVLRNDICVALPFLVFLYHCFEWRGCAISGPLPSITQIVVHFAVFLVVEEICFFYAHRLFHSGQYYVLIHKQHHEWTAPIGLVARYCHVLEHLCANLMPVALGPFICGSHFFTCWLWFILASVNSVNSHCGYHFPFQPDPMSHDFHHMKFNNNFGVLGFLDTWYGTNKNYMQFLADPANHRPSPWQLIGIDLPASVSWDNLIMYLGLPCAIAHFCLRA